MFNRNFMENNNTSNNYGLNRREVVSENVQRLETYFSYLHSSGRRVVEQGGRHLDDGTLLLERRKDYYERSDSQNIGREAFHGFIDRIRKEMRKAVKEGETCIFINASLPDLLKFYPKVNVFMDDLCDYLEAEEGIIVPTHMLTVEKDNGSRDLRISFKGKLKDDPVEDNSIPQDNPEDLEKFAPIELYFKYLERAGGGRRDAKVDDQSIQERRSPREAKEAMEGFIERIKRGILEAMENGFDAVHIQVDLESIDKLPKDFHETFGDYLFKEVNDNGGRFNMWDIKIGQTSKNELILMIEFTDLEKLNRNRKLDSSPRKKISTIRSKIGLALMFVGALTIGLGGAKIYSQFGKKSKSAQPQITEVDQSLTTVVAPEVDTEKIYCEVYRHPEGYNAACRGTQNKKLSALEDDDNTDDLVPIQIDVARDGINYACQGIVQKTQPNEDGSVKTILAEDLDCEMLE